MSKLTIAWRLCFIFSFIFSHICFCNMPHIVQAYKKNLQDEWNKLEAKLLASLHITKNRWDSFQKNHNQAYVDYEIALKKEKTKSSTPCSPKIQAIINNVCKELRLDTRNIDFILKEETFERASASDSGVYLSEKNLSAHNATDKEIAASILHELQHTWHWDDSYNYFVELFIHTHAKKINNVQATQSHKQIRYFQEKRADILAGLYSLVYARALHNCYKKLDDSGVYPDTESGTHPSFVERIAYLETLCEEMKQDSDMQYGKPYADFTVFKSRSNSDNNSWLAQIVKRIIG